jgi:hypothetical protein
MHWSFRVLYGMLIGLAVAQDLILVERLQELIFVFVCPNEEIDTVLVEEVIKVVVSCSVIVAIRSNTIKGYMP